MLKNKITNISALQFYQLLRYTTLVIISILLSKSYFTQVQIGEYETLLFIAGSVSFFWLNSIIKSFLSLHKRANKEQSDIFNFYILILIFSIVIFLILKILVLSKISGLHNIKYVNLITYYILLIGTSSISEYILLVKNKIKEIFIYGVISYSIQFIIVGCSIFIFADILYVLYSLILVSILRNIFTMYIVAKYSTIKISIQFLKNNLKLSYPLMFSFLLSGSAQYIDGIIVKYKYNNDVFAIFRYGTKEFPILIILTDALSNALVSEFSSTNIKNVLLKLKQKSTKLIKYLFPVSILLLVFSNYLFQYIFNKQFIESAKVFDIYLLLIISRMLFPQTIMLGLRNTKIIFSASIIEFIINVTLSLLLVQYYGIEGVAFATIIAFISEKLFLIYKLKTVYKISAKEYINIKQLLLFSLLLIFIFIIKYFFI